MEENTVENTVENTEEVKKGKKKNQYKPFTGKWFLNEIKEWVVALVVALVIVSVLQGFLFRIIKVDGRSMETTLTDGERLFVTVYDVRFGDVDRDDVVICNYPGRTNALLGFFEPIQVKTFFVKRCVAIPGDTIYRTNGVTHVVYIDADGQEVDEALDERYALYNQGGSTGDFEPRVLGEDEYYMVGDNRYNSHDSRADDVGPISKDMIVGHVRQVIWPVSNWRSVGLPAQ